MADKNRKSQAPQKQDDVIVPQDDATGSRPSWRTARRRELILMARCRPASRTRSLARPRPACRSFVVAGSLCIEMRHCQENLLLDRSGFGLGWGYG
jgi:hypothetical protein